MSGSRTLDYPQSEENLVRIPHGVLREVIIKTLVKYGVYPYDAEVVADRMLEADLRGIQSHGVRMLPRYLEDLDLGDIDPRGTPVLVRETVAMATMDGSRSFGHVAATRGMELAIKKARDVGTGTVAIGNSQHYGAASVYALMAAREGMIGFSTTSTAHPTVAAYGSRRAGTANNALSWALPTRSGVPYCLDMACGATSWGKIQMHAARGLPIPLGLAIDEHGNDTTDAKAAKTILPAAGARGSGLALVCSVLAGPLAGGRLPIHKTRRSSTEDSEHFFMVIDVGQFTDIEQFHAELESSLKEMRALDPAPGFDRVRMPGDLEAEREERNRRAGVPLLKDDAEAIKKVARGKNVEAPW